jgi:hypothetical protein
MATRQAILATAKAIQRLLAEACPAGDFPSIEIKIVQAGELTETNPQFEGISILLYQITTNLSQRSIPGRISPAGKRAHPSLPLDLYFLLTPWSSHADMQLNLLGWAMQVLNASPVIPAGYLNRDFPNGEVFRSDEAIKLIYNRRWRSYGKTWARRESYPQLPMWYAWCR